VVLISSKIDDVLKESSESGEMSWSISEWPESVLHIEGRGVLAGVGNGEVLGE
jgi:hypothetical protein